MKKYLVIIAAMVLAVTLSACNNNSSTTGSTAAPTSSNTGSNTNPQPTGNFEVENGKYFAVGEADEKGYVYYVVVTVENQDITAVEWNGYNVDGSAMKCLGKDKYTCAKDGLYGMNTAHGTWDVQADLAEAWLLENQTTDITFTNSKADAITSVSITTEEFFTLVDEALESDPVPTGSFTTDGYYFIKSTVEEDKPYTYKAQKQDGTVLADITGTFDSYTFGTFVIVNGTIVLADFNATQVAYQFKVDETGKLVKIDNKSVVLCGEDGSPLKSYVTKDLAKEMYGMSSIGKVEWYKQIETAEQKLLADQELVITISLDSKGEDSGVIDGLTSVSMGHTVASLKEILDQLEEAAN